MNTQQILQEICHIVNGADRILITGQGNPDGDSLGSQLALYDILLQQRRATTPNRVPEIVITNDFPPPVLYHFFPKIDIITPVEHIPQSRYDVGFVLDSGTDRVGKVLPMLETCQHIINIDHHQSRADGIETLAWIEPETCSVAEMVFAFFEHPAWYLELTADIAASLYAGIIYDTGSFRYPKTTPRTHQIAAKLLETGCDFARISEQLFLEKPLSSIRLLQEVLNTLQCSTNGTIIWGRITQETLRRVGATLDQDEGIITQYAFTKGTDVAALFKEISNREIKVSFRSHGAIDVGQFAQKMSHDGGGHSRAAGCTLHNMAMEEAEEYIVSALSQKMLDKMENTHNYL